MFGLSAKRSLSLSSIICAHNNTKILLRWIFNVSHKMPSINDCSKNLAFIRSIITAYTF